MKKDEIIAKKYGRNLVVIIDGEKKTRVINTDKDKKDEQSIKNKILLYNKKNNTSLKEQILSLVDISKSIKDEKIATKKGIKKAIKKEVKKKEIKQVIKSNSDLINEIEQSNLSAEDTERLERILNKTKSNQKQTESIPKTTVTPRRGEY